MAGSKSMARTIGQETFAQCEVHQPLLRAADNVLEYDQQLPLDQVIGAVNAGKMIVAAAFGPRIEHAHTVEIFPDKLIEERRSAHGVTFGRILSKRHVAPDGIFSSQTALNVALKPFSSPIDAIREMQGYFTLRDLGVPTFEPVGVFPAAHGGHVIGMTVKNNDLVSLDRHKWIVGRNIDSEYSLAQAEHNNLQIKGIAETLAYIHANGVYHPDGQIKNYVANASDKIGVIDTEKQIVKPLGDQDAAMLAWDDIEKLVKSLVINNYLEDDGKMFGVGMLANLPLRMVRSSIEELIVHPYLAKLENMSVEAGTQQSKQIEKLYDGLADNFYNEENWPQHLIDFNKS